MQNSGTSCQTLTAWERWISATTSYFSVNYKLLDLHLKQKHEIISFWYWRVFCFFPPLLTWDPRGSLSRLTADVQSSKSSHAIVEKAVRQEKCVCVDSTPEMCLFTHAVFIRAHINMHESWCVGEPTLFNDAGELHVHSDRTAASWPQHFILHIENLLAPLNSYVNRCKEKCFMPFCSLQLSSPVGPFGWGR